MPRWPSQPGEPATEAKTDADAEYTLAAVSTRLGCQTAVPVWRRAPTVTVTASARRRGLCTGPAAGERGSSVATSRTVGQLSESFQSSRLLVAVIVSD